MRKLIILIFLVAALIIACAPKETPQNQTQQINQTKIEQKNVTQNIKCYYDSDCGARRAENAYCFQGNPIGDLYEWRCDNPGTASSRCVEIHNKGTIAICGDDYFCNKGACVKFANCNDTDSGLNFDVKGKVITNDFAVHEDYCKKSDTLVEYYCSSDDRAFSETKTCMCESGKCVETRVTNE